MNFWDIFRKNTVLCIDIGYRNIKIVEVDVRKKNDLVILNYAIVPTPLGVIKNGAIYNVPRVVAEIKNAIQAQKIRSKNAKIIMSGTNIITRIYMMDKVEGESYEDTIEKSIPQYLPVKIEDYRIDYKILQIVKEQEMEKYKVFVTGVPKSILETYIDVIRGLGLIPLAVDIPANSTAKFFNRDIQVKTLEVPEVNTSGENETFAVLDFGSETTIVNFLKDRVLEFNKVILAGSSNIDDYISKTLQIPVERAEQLKKMYGMVPPNSLSSNDHTSAYYCVKEFVEKLIKQVIKCFEFYVERCYGEKISRIYVIGGGSQLLGLTNYLYSIFDVPVYPVGIVDLKGIELKSNLDREQLYYLINSVGIAL